MVEMDSLDRLRQRKTEATPDEQLMGYIFSGLVELVAKEVGDAEMVKVRERLKLPKRVIPFFKYPMAPFLALVEELVRLRLARGQPLQEILEWVGDAGTRPFLESPAGQLMQSLNGGNVHRMLAYTATAYSTAYSFGERKAEKTGERTATLSYEKDLMGPAIQAGVVKVGLGLPCRVTLAVSLIRSDLFGRNFTLGLSW